MSANGGHDERGGLRAALAWAIGSWLHPADDPAGWEQRAGRRLGLGETDIGPQNPPTSGPERNPAHQASRATPQSH